MIGIMKRRLLTIVLALTFAVSVAPKSFAGNSDEDAPKLDARMDGYKDGNVALKDASGTGGAWMMMIVLGGLCLGVLFMNSKRSHLD
jgi:hypothetical protein